LVDGELVVTAAEHRSQLQNRRAAEARLVATLTVAIAPPTRTRRATRPSQGAVQRRLDTKRHRSQIKRMRGRPEEEDIPVPADVGPLWTVIGWARRERRATRPVARRSVQRR